MLNTETPTQLVHVAEPGFDDPCLAGGVEPLRDKASELPSAVLDVAAADHGDHRLTARLREGAEVVIEVVDRLEVHEELERWPLAPVFLFDCDPLRQHSRPRRVWVDRLPTLAGDGPDGIAPRRWRIPRRLKFRHRRLGQRTPAPSLAAKPADPFGSLGRRLSEIVAHGNLTEPLHGNVTADLELLLLADVRVFVTAPDKEGSGRGVALEATERRVVDEELSPVGGRRSAMGEHVLTTFPQAELRELGIQDEVVPGPIQLRRLPFCLPRLQMIGEEPFEHV